jgi:hypothetical protein
MFTTTDWQVLAYEGRAIEAIRAHRVAHGTGLAEAKAAVERWMAISVPPSVAFQIASRVARKITDTVLEYLRRTSLPLAFSVSVIPPHPKEVVGQNTHFFANIPVDRPTLDLAVEVAMEGVPGGLRRDVARSHLAEGVRMVWVVEADDPTVHVYTDRLSHPLYHDGAEFDGGDVLPGFSCKVSDLFA